MSNFKGNPLSLNEITNLAQILYLNSKLGTNVSKFPKIEQNLN
jgi:hypothetical protein